MATLTATEILSDTLDAFKVAAPFINDFSTDLSAGTAVKGQQVIAHIDTLPSASTYDATTGYKNGATESNTLVEDVPVTLDQHSHVPVKIDYLNAISDQKQVYGRQIGNTAYVLAKGMADYCLGKVVAANFSESTTEAIADTDRDTLGAVRKAMNVKGASPAGRFGIVNSDFFEKLDQNPQITSQDYYNQRTAGVSLGQLSNVAGFRSIYEYPDLPSTGNMSAFFGDSRAIALATRLPDHNTAIAEALGIPNPGRFEVVQDEDTGLALLGIQWIDPGTFDTYLTVTLLYGAAAGSQGGSAGDKADYAGHLVVTA